MKIFPSTRMLGIGLSLLVALFAATAVYADTFPSRPLRLIVPLTPGSGSDSVSRFMAERLGKELGQNVVVENKPGAETLIATQALLSAPADGYSLLMLSPTSMVINPLTKDKLPYDVRDIRPLVSAIRATAVLVAGPASSYKNFKDVATAAGKQPKTVSFATYSSHYLLGALQLQQMANVEFNQVPYKGAAQVQTDLVGGAIDVALLDIGGALPLIRSGKLVPLATTGKARHPELPNVPTMNESGVAGYELTVWIGFGVLAKTPERRPPTRALGWSSRRHLCDPVRADRLSRVADLRGARSG